MTEMSEAFLPQQLWAASRTAGYEFVQDLGLVDNAPVIAEQAVQLLSAEQCPSDLVTTVIWIRRSWRFRSTSPAATPSSWIELLAQRQAMPGPAF